MRVAFDATALVGAGTGVAAFTRGAFGALAARDCLDLVGYALSWRVRRGLAPALPPGVTAAARPVPAGPLLRVWSRLDAPWAEMWTGPVDVVHGTNFVVPPTRRAAAVVTVHDLAAVRFPELCAPTSRRYPVLVRRALARGAFVHTPSRAVAAEVVELLGADPDRVRAVHHGVDEVGGADAGAGRRLARAEQYVLALGTVEPRKDLPGLVRAFDHLAPARPDLHLVIAGPDGWGTEALAAAMAASPHRDRIVRLGYVGTAERASLLAGAAVFAYPSVYEGFGLPPLEAMAAGTPVVATAAGSLPEVLGEAARLVPARDETALATALAEVLDDGRVRTDLAERGRRQAARYRWSDSGEGLLRLYRQALGGSR
jgi:glycosyltransferase involved in cell wall biosynthesis